MWGVGENEATHEDRLCWISSSSLQVHSLPSIVSVPWEGGPRGCIASTMWLLVAFGPWQAEQGDKFWKEVVR